jgi:hypothetical protein
MQRLILVHLPQGAIRKIMFDQKQKALGLPTSDEMTTNDILEKAKHLPGKQASAYHLWLWLCLWPWW